MYILFGRMLKFQFLAQFPVDHLPHPFVSNLIHILHHLLHSLIMRLIVSSLSPNNLHLLLCFRFKIIGQGDPRGVMVKALDNHAITFTFGQIPLRKV